MFDERDRPDVFDYLNDNGIEGLETEPTHDSSVRELEDLLATYVIHREEDEIQDYEYRYITTVRIYTLIKKCGEIYQKQGERSRDEFLKDDEVTPEAAQEMADRVGRYTVGNNVMVIYTLGYELVKDLMGDLLLEILDEDIATEMGKRQLQNQIGKYQTRAQLLDHFDLIDNSYLSDIAHIRENRRDLVHDVERRFDLKMLESINDLWDIIHIVNHLYDALYGRPAYRFIEE
ncbi:hypothetical protein EXE46_05060 [Halorubrum sp. GN11_10-6_MGM]|uniref:hypothetical protein n=1 Tax=Halorubrum sp. GN11_10-6_MGM TaxID=2518112 RepID=UPI0010F4E050|nr:hypothetical protein [Halorubrum sp. GN11_10-6_MGM]TKX75234.1 hypothetical protein EXE46_05060 [Halorubrum sp. GN11_10-6_MGM]